MGQCFCYLGLANDPNFSSLNQYNDLKKTQRSFNSPYKSYIKIDDVKNVNVKECKEICDSEGNYFLQNSIEEEIKITATSVGRFSSPIRLEETRRKSKTISKEDFIFIKVIGRGSFGKVMLVEKKNTG